MTKSPKIFKIKHQEKADRFTAVFAGRNKKMKKYRCIPCGYIYDPAEGDPDGGIAPGTAFEDIPDDWQCPICFVGKDEFEPIDD